MNKLEFPIKLDYAVNGEKFTEDDRFNDLVDKGYDEDFLSDHFRYLVYELECSLELHENGDSYITHIAGQEMNPPLKNK